MEHNEATDAQLNRDVLDILTQVREQGDRAVLNYTRRFDERPALTIENLEISAQQMSSALTQITTEQREALTVAATRIRNYHEHQTQQSWQFEEADGTVLGQRINALQRVGIYVPGGKASYPSTVLMNAIPARVAGVEEIIMTVPAPGDSINPLVLAAAELVGVNRVFTVGGAQAIAALCYGTETIPSVDKIVGPGNRYVAAAKKAVFGQVGLDMVAGPSEILVISDAGTNPEWIAMDLFSQAEHDEEAQAILISPDGEFLDQVLRCMEALLPTMERQAIIRAAMERRGALIKVSDMDEAVALANRIAPEHLQLAVDEPATLLADVRHAGAVFLGRHTPEALGDYCAGSNHVLPTSTTARFSSPLGVYDFQKRTSVIACSPAGAATLAKTASVLARSESLTAHARSAEYRLQE
ncbi:MAG: histidinol dehydrogenase [Gammaproteobacteria bacterium]|nr:MAG: histidinol dehydrogenase [Gammaproteobacteria bacterium]RLA53610.1 MAG: histidinol dehydrogenase [Gammaproteobacteria bacterium]